MKLHRVSVRLRILANPDRPLLKSDLEARVQSLWEVESKRRAGSLFNGRLFSIDEFSRDSITGVFAEYRWFVAQKRQPDLFERLRIRPLAVSGIVESPDGLIFGRRGTELTTDAGKWELAPSGGIDSSSCLRDYTVDYAKQFLSEISEEVGIEQDQVAAIAPLVLIEDEATHVFDLAVTAHTQLRAKEIHEAFLRTQREYSEIKLVKISALSSFVHDRSISVVPITLELLRYRGFLEGHQ